MSTVSSKVSSLDDDPSAKRAAYDLWFDESGQFMETSTRPEERAVRQDFPSQLVGLLVPRGSLTESAATSALKAAYKAAKLSLDELVHGNEIARDNKKSYEPLIAALLTEIHGHGWQPIRLVNLEGVRYGDRVTTYTQMVAELVLRVLRELALQGEPRVDLVLHGANVVLEFDRNREPTLLAAAEYDERIQKALSFLAVRRGLADKISGWTVASVQLHSGMYRRQLQVCDLLSHSSHASFKHLGPETRAAFVEALGPFDQSLIIRELFERVDDLVLDRSYGRALMLLAESGIDPEQSKDAGFSKRISDIVRRLAALGARARDPELAALVTWVEQIIEHRRALEEGRMLATFLLRELDAPLGALIDVGSSAGEADWFTYALHRWTLTASNHLGDLVVGRSAVKQLDALTPALAQRWEHVSLLMQGLTAQAVHYTDCFSYDEAAARMKVVATYYRELSGLFSTVMPTVFPEQIRSDARAAAVGTWVQIETYAGLRDPKRLDLARALNDEAIAELSTEDDRTRQRQYRSHVETVAGNFAEAREQLGRSLGLDVFTHDALGKAIVAIANPFTQGFALLHWMRLGRAAAMFVGAEREAFLAAVTAAKIVDVSWLAGEQEDYPAHGILRQDAVVQAIQGSIKDAIGSLTRLRRARRGLVLSTIVLAATVEVAAILWAKNRKDAELLLDNKEPNRLGALQQLQALGHAAKDGVPELWSVFAPWEAAIRGVLGDNAGQRDPRDVLIGLARVVPY